MILLHKAVQSFPRVACKSYSLNALKVPIFYNNVRLCSSETRAVQKITIRSMRGRSSQYHSIVSLGLLVIPVSAFGLGTWQLFRTFEKEEINEKFMEMTNQPAVDFPKNLEELNNLEYRRVRVKGKFDHSKELYLGPRPHLTEETFTKPTSLLSVSNAGYMVVTPFILSDRDLTIMVNRGWVPAKQKLPDTRKEGQITEEVELIGVVRLNEGREPLGSKNMPEVGFWLYRDLHKMSEFNGAAPIFLDAVRECNVPGGPDGGQTYIKLRNDHISYLITWYLLSAVSGYLWFLRHFKKPTIVV